MDYIKYISTPASTTEASPLVTKLTLTKGRLSGGFLWFPYGPAGTLHFLARKGARQILPSNPGDNFRADDAVIPLSLGIDLSEPPYVIDLVTRNDSASYAHVLTIGLFIDPF